MSLLYLIGLARRAAMGKEFSSHQKAHFSQFLGENIGDKDGVIEWSDVTDTLSTAAEKVGEVAGEVAEGIGEIAGNVGEAISENIGDIIGSLFG